MMPEQLTVIFKTEFPALRARLSDQPVWGNRGDTRLSPIGLNWLMRLRAVLLLVALVGGNNLSAQTHSSVNVDVLDPTGAVVVNASVSLNSGQHAFNATPLKAGQYILTGIPPGHYDLRVTAPGFADYQLNGVAILPGVENHLRVSLMLPVEHQNVTISGRGGGLSLEPGENASATIISGDELNSLSDDPAELQNELQALAGPGAGPIDLCINNVMI